MMKKAAVKRIGILLIAIILLLTSTIVWASSYSGTVTIPEGVQTKYTNEMSFESGSIHFLSSASAWNVFLNETTYTLYLEKKELFGIWFTHESVALPNNSNSSITFTNKSAGTYRFRLVRPRSDSGHITVSYEAMN